MAFSILALDLVSSLGPFQPSAIALSRYVSLGMIPGHIWKTQCNNLYLTKLESQIMLRVFEGSTSKRLNRKANGSTPKRLSRKAKLEFCNPSFQVIMVTDVNRTQVLVVVNIDYYIDLSISALVSFRGRKKVIPTSVVCTKYDIYVL
jgi:hypothetical protein